MASYKTYKFDSLNIPLENLLRYTVENAYGISIFRNPESRFVEVIIDPNYQQISYPIDLLTTKGFVFIPFEQSQQHPNILLAPEIHYIFDLSNNQIFTNDVLDAPLFILQTKKESEKAWFYKENTFATYEKDSFLKDIVKIVNKLKANELKKVVIARCIQQNLKNAFSPSAFFFELLNSYPAAFVYLFSTQETGTWMGASPELLVSDNNSEFKTVALAGTKLNKYNESVSQTTWTQKEIEEQAYVSRYIIGCFKHIRLREYEESGPKTVSAGNLLHLKTEYKVDKTVINYDNLGSSMLQLLHPTAAVCGTPKLDALTLIKQYEQNTRAYYTGFVGTVNIALNESLSPQTQLFVNLRCMQLLEKNAILYAGAGITIDSNPESEWTETENKINVLLKLLD